MTDTPQMIPRIQGIDEPAQNQIAAGSEHSLAINHERSVFAWGSNLYGQLGNPTLSSYFHLGGFGEVASMKVFDNSAQDFQNNNIQMVSAGIAHSLALRNGTVFAWGSNAYGQLGSNTGNQIRLNSSISGSDIPIRVPIPQRIISISAGGAHSLALSDTGSVFAWGSNKYGQINSTLPLAPVTAPIQIPLSSPIMKISAGLSHNLAIDTTGQLIAWGSNIDGEIGVGTFRTPPVPPTIIAGGNQFRDISAGGRFSMALHRDGALFRWGQNNNGQLGTGSFIPLSVPTMAPRVKGGFASDPILSSISAGASHSLALALDTTSAFGWGNNEFGQAGTQAPVLYPKKITSADIGFIFGNIAAGDTHSLFSIRRKETQLY